MCRPLALLALLALAACGGSSPTTPPTTVPVATITVSPSSAVLLTSQTVQLTATLKDAAGNTLTGRNVTWSASPTSVATVSATGLVTPVAQGTVTVTVTSEGKSVTATVTVAIPFGSTITSAGGSVTSADGDVTLTFPAGALATATPVTVAPIVSPPNAPSAIAGTGFDFGPSGTQFAKPVTATIKYQPGALPAGFDPRFLNIYTYDGTAWTQALPSTVDTVQHTVRGLLQHFSIYTVCGLFCSPVVPPSIPGIKVFFYSGFERILRGGSSGVINGFLLTSGADAIGPIYSLGQPCAYLGCTPLPDGLITATFTDLGVQNGSLPCFPGRPDCGRGYQFVLHVAAATPPGTYPVVVDVLATVGGTLKSGQSWAINVEVPAYAYTLTLTSLALTAPTGGSANTTVNVSRFNDFVAPVALNVENLPAGITASFNPASVTGNSSTLTLTIGSSVPAGEYSPSLRATTPGFADIVVPFGLTVTATPVSGFSVVGTPPTISVNAGASATTGIRATRTGGFAGAITYSATGLPTGLTAAVTNTAVADSVSLSVTASASLAAGTYPITVNATSGATVHQAPVTVSVSTAGLVAVHLDYSLCSASSKPIWLAYQDGTGAFIHLAGSGDVYDFSITSARGAIATVVSGGGGYTTSVHYATQTELSLASSHQVCSASTLTPGTKVVNASVLNTANFDINITLGPLSLPSGNAAVGHPVVVQGVAPGPQDAIAFMGSAPRLAIIRRDQDIPNGGSLAPFDFASAEAFPEATAHLSLPGATRVGMGYITNASCAPSILYNPTTVSLTTIYGVTAAQQRPADMHMLSASSGNGQSLNKIFHTMADQSLGFGAALPAGLVANGNGSVYKQLNAAFTMPSDYTDLSLTYDDGHNGFTLSASTAFAGGSSISLAAPNLAGVAGYLTSWAPGRLSTANYVLVAESPFLPCTEGTVLKSSQLRGSM